MDDRGERNDVAASLFYIENSLRAKYTRDNMGHVANLEKQSSIF